MLPDNFPRFRHVTVTRPGPGAALVRWSVLPHSWDTADMAYLLFRSNSPEGPWEYVGTAPDGMMQYTDYGVQSMNVSRNYYFIVRVVSKSQQGFRDSPVANPGHDPDGIAYELVRKKLTFLTVRSGVAGAFLIRKSWGAKCSRCYSRERMLPTDPDCPDCFGTGYSGGYLLPPVYTPTLINPPKQAVVEAGIKYEAFSIYVEIANVPYINPDDIFVDMQSNIRYRVENVGSAAHRGFVVSQVAQLNRVDEHDVLYTIPVPLPPGSAVEQSWDLMNRMFPGMGQRTLAGARPAP